MKSLKKFASLSLIAIPILTYAQNLEESGLVVDPAQNQLMGPVIDLSVVGNPAQEEVIEEVLFEQDDILSTYQYWGQTSNKEKISEFLSNGQNVNDDFFDGTNLLILSSMRKNQELFNLSLAYKANISHKNNEGKNLLHYVFSDFNQVFFDNLRDKVGLKKIDELANVKDKYGATPAHYYFLSSKLSDEKMVESYMFKQINLEDKKGLTPGHYALNSPNCMNLNTWLKAGGDITKKNQDGVSLEELMFDKCSVHSVVKNFNYMTDSGKARINDVCAKIGLREDSDMEILEDNQINQCIVRDNI